MNFYRHSDQGGSDSEDVAAGSNRERDRDQADRDDEHRVYRTHRNDERDDWLGDEVAVAEAEALGV